MLIDKNIFNFNNNNRTHNYNMINKFGNPNELINQKKRHL